MNNQGKNTSGSIYGKIIGVATLLFGAYMNFIVLSETNLPSARSFNMAEQTTLIVFAAVLELGLNFFQKDIWQRKSDGVTIASLLLDAAIKGVFFMPFLNVMMGGGNLTLVIAFLVGGAYATLTHYSFTH